MNKLQRSAFGIFCVLLIILSTYWAFVRMRFAGWESQLKGPFSGIPIAIETLPTQYSILPLQDQYSLFISNSYTNTADDDWPLLVLLGPDNSVIWGRILQPALNFPGSGRMDTPFIRNVSLRKIKTGQKEIKVILSCYWGGGGHERASFSSTENPSILSIFPYLGDLNHQDQRMAPKIWVSSLLRAFAPASELGYRSLATIQFRAAIKQPERAVRFFACDLSSFLPSSLPHLRTCAPCEISSPPGARPAPAPLTASPPASTPAPPSAHNPPSHTSPPTAVHQLVPDETSPATHSPTPDPHDADPACSSTSPPL